MKPVLVHTEEASLFKLKILLQNRQDFAVPLHPREPVKVSGFFLQTLRQDLLELIEDLLTLLQRSLGTPYTRPDIALLVLRGQLLPIVFLEKNTAFVDGSLQTVLWEPPIVESLCLSHALLE